MTSITLKLTGAKAQAVVTGPLTSGMVGIPVFIECDDAWEGLTKNLVCRSSQWGPDRGEVRTVAVTGETATVAHEVMKADRYLYLGIEGCRGDGTLVMPTTWAECGLIQHGANAGTDPSTDATLPFWAQLQAEIMLIKQQIITQDQIDDAIESYLEKNPAQSPDASQSGTGLTAAQSGALDGMFQVCVYDSTKNYTGAYTAFKTAFGISDSDDSGGDSGETEVTLTGISATYSGGDVAVGTAVTDLTGIVVRAHYSDGTSRTVTGYTLSGTIAEGSNTITVTYQGKTAAFTVTGVAEAGGDEESATPLGVEWTEGIIVNKGAESANATWVTSDYFSVADHTEIRIYNDTGKLFNFYVNYFDAEKVYVSQLTNQFVQGSTAYPSPLVLAIPDGCAYARLSTAIQSGSASAGYVQYTELTYELV